MNKKKRLAKVSINKKTSNIDNYQKELDELCGILNQEIMFVSDDAVCWFNERL